MDEKSMRAAIKLHRPVMYDKYVHETEDESRCVHRRCRECGMYVEPEGCPTWRIANGAQ